MTSITLFDAAQAVRAAINQIDPDTGELSESYTESRALFEQKAVACVAYAKEQAASIASARAMLKTMAEKIDAEEARLDRFKTYLAD